MNGSAHCYYSNSIDLFLSEDNDSISGKLCNSYHGNLMSTQIEAWEKEIPILKDVLEPWEGNDGQVIFEYDIPRLGKRIDVVVLLKGIIFCIEFKAGKSKYEQSDIDQVMDYALDLKNFHKESHDCYIVPILVATEADTSSSVIQVSAYDDKVINPLVTGGDKLLSLISLVISKYPNENPISDKWIISRYAPTPTIIEAARTLYVSHTVEAITRHEIDNVYTDKTIEYILEVIQNSKKNRQKSICFVTGVPGAGKTLVGLDVAIRQTFQGKDEPQKGELAVYLSGNGPLVAVLIEALTRDNYEKCKANGKSKKLSDSRREVGEFIQIIHRYRDVMVGKIKNPVENGMLEIDPEKAIREKDKAGYAEVEHVAIFDEAQRSWTHKRLADYLKRGGTYGNKTKVANFPLSEASFLIWSLDQREDWATIVCLVGGGQEIHTGEAGISEWINALNETYTNWKVYIAPQLKEAEYADGKVSELLQNNPNVTYSEHLHLGTSLRAYKAEKLSAFVHALLDVDSSAASLYEQIKDEYPIILTRNMNTAKNWLHEKVRGTERTGVLITKESARYKPLGIHVLPQGDENAVHWFLEDKIDTRASNYLEDAATEIQVQGLELDYTCLLWDADMRYENGKWRFFNFNGKTEWVEQFPGTESKDELRKYMLNAYRVLLTRARAGMIICVPEGNGNKTATGYYEDKTRLPEFYDGTYQYLKSIGIEEIE